MKLKKFFLLFCLIWINSVIGSTLYDGYPFVYKIAVNNTNNKAGNLIVSTVDGHGVHINLNHSLPVIAHTSSTYTFLMSANSQVIVSVAPHIYLTTLLEMLVFHVEGCFPEIGDNGFVAGINIKAPNSDQYILPTLSPYNVQIAWDDDHKTGPTCLTRNVIPTATCYALRNESGKSPSTIIPNWNCGTG